MINENTFELPLRNGIKPKTTPSNPHMQLNQQPEDRKLVDSLMDWAFSLPEINKEFSKISVPGAQAMCLSSDKMCNDCHAFMIGNEFAHFHPVPDGSMPIPFNRDLSKGVRPRRAANACRAGVSSKSRFPLARRISSCRVAARSVNQAKPSWRPVCASQPR